MSEDPHAIHTALAGLWDTAAERMAEAQAAPLVIGVDRHFTVKGVGLVAIGHVLQGRVSRHDELRIEPHGGTVTARSLQVMDDDVDETVAGDRGSLALRGGDESWLGRGTLIVHSARPDPRTKQGGWAAGNRRSDRLNARRHALAVPAKRLQPEDGVHGALDLHSPSDAYARWGPGRDGGLGHTDDGQNGEPGEAHAGPARCRRDSPAGHGGRTRRSLSQLRGPRAAARSPRVRGADYHTPRGWEPAETGKTATVRRARRVHST